MYTFHSSRFARANNSGMSFPTTADLPEGAQVRTEADLILIAIPEPDINWMLGRWDTMPSHNAKLVCIAGSDTANWVFHFEKQ